MPFNTSQASHRALRSVVAEKTRKLVVWVGSGLSAEAGLPTWTQLRSRLVQALREKADAIATADADNLLRMADRSDAESNHWLAFQILQNHIGRTTYRSTIRDALRLAPTAACPQAYLYVWKLRPAGVVNLNLDRLLTKALSSVSSALLPVEFSGRRAQSYLHALNSPRPFIANLHGIAEEADSWVFTRDELKKLLKSPAYRAFITSCFTATTTLFVGISADDRAAGGHLASLAQAGIDTGPHYWLTDRDDFKTDTWAEQAGIQLIRYQSCDDHAEVAEFFEDILQFVPPEDSSAPPVMLQQLTAAPSALPNAAELLQRDAEAIRQVLNAHALALLRPETPTSYVEYAKFAKAYDQAIYRAWYTSVTEPENRLLGFTLDDEVARGAFGRVYRATASDGQVVAIKVLLEDVRRDPDLLGSFRRGVRSMRYLRSRCVDGMVAYKEASEIPAFVVMDWVDGPTLSEAREAQQINDWASILKVATEMTAVIRRAHGIPERVLHRDIRPSNIMFDGFYSRPDHWRVVVLDFDLSWHTGAHERSVIHGALTGYLAPEQIQVTPGASTRHAAVDSFGVGMTLYYLISGKDPLPTQHMHEDWEGLVKRAALDTASAEWVSLPYRYARLVIRATRDKQAERWDIAMIHDELNRLRAAVASQASVVSAELVAEEIAARCGREYEWDDNSATATMQLASGLEIRIAGNDTQRQVIIGLRWDTAGQHDRKQVGKWIPQAMERCVALLRKSKWRIGATTMRRPTSMAVEATRSTRSAVTSLSSVAAAISEVIRELNFE